MLARPTRSLAGTNIIFVHLGPFKQFILQIAIPPLQRERSMSPTSAIVHTRRGLFRMTGKKALRQAQTRQQFDRNLHCPYTVALLIIDRWRSSTTKDLAFGVSDLGNVLKV